MTSAGGALASPTFRLGRWSSWLGLPVAAALILASSSPWIAQLLPRFLIPTLAGVGAAWASLTFVAALLRLARGDHRARGSNLRRLAVPLVGVVVLAVMPLSHLVGLLIASSTGPPHILAAFGDWFGSEGHPLPGPHRGVDLAGRAGVEVLAAADGRVAVARHNRDVCGLIVAIVHEPEGYRTVYCHFSEIVVRLGDLVRRGQRIGRVGTTGQGRMAGCFEAAATYPTDRLVLTYPLPCQTRERR